MACHTLEISPDEPIEFEKIFNYFILSGCSDNYLKTIRPEMAQYFNNESNKFYVPCDIAEEYLLRRFNTKVDRNTIDSYDPKTECYVFSPLYGEFYYDLETLSFKSYKNIYTIEIAYRHSLDDSFSMLPYRARYNIELGENYEYRFLSVESVDAVTISAAGKNSFITYSDGIICTLEKSESLECSQCFWITEVPKNEGIYTIQTAFDGNYGLSVNDKNEIIIKRSNNWNLVSNDNYLDFQFAVEKLDDGTFAIRSLLNGKYLTIDEYGFAFSAEKFAFTIEKTSKNIAD